MKRNVKLGEIKSMSIEENKKLVEKYPFLIPRNRWTGFIPDDYDYSYTEIDDMPTGWRKAFGLQMCDEIAEILKKADYLNEYRITQIKEKYGYLRWYDFGVPESIFTELGLVIAKYEVLSSKICIKCGKPATKVTLGWIEPYCDECISNNCKYADIDEYYLESEK